MNYKYVLEQKYIVFCTREFVGYKSDVDYEGNAQFGTTVRLVLYTHKPGNKLPVSKRSLERLIEAHTKDIANRKYQREGRFFTYAEDDKDLLNKFNVYVWDNGVYDYGYYPCAEAEAYATKLMEEVRTTHEY